MLNNANKKQLIKVAKMYYFEQLTQAKIAQKLGVSRPIISKMLGQAREEGIVEIKIHDDGFDVTRLEQAMATHFQLDDVVVVPTENMSAERKNSALGAATAQYVSKALKGVEKIGVSWGKALYEMVKAYPVEKREQIKVISLVGGMGTKAVELHANQIAYEWAKKLGGECELLYTPTMVEPAELMEYLLDSPRIAGVLEQGKHVDLAIVGIGNPFVMSTIVEIDYLGDAEIEQLQAAHVVGDIGSKYLLADGREADHAMNRKGIGIELSDLKNISRVIGVAAGLHKVDSILASLRGGYLSVLITDDQTASALEERVKID